jgi:hypothetical protein
MQRYESVQGRLSHKVAGTYHGLVHLQKTASALLEIIDLHNLAHQWHGMLNLLQGSAISFCRYYTGNSMVPTKLAQTPYYAACHCHSCILQCLNQRLARARAEIR